jgi:hypothetical protein
MTNHEPTTDTPYTLARSSASHETIWTNGQELSNAAVLSHLNGQEAALVEATRDLGEARESLEAMRTRALKAEDALVEIIDLGEWTWSEANDATLFTIHLREAHYEELLQIVNRSD